MPSRAKNRYEVQYRLTLFVVNNRGVHPLFTRQWICRSCFSSLLFLVFLSSPSPLSSIKYFGIFLQHWIHSTRGKDADGVYNNV